MALTEAVPAPIRRYWTCSGGVGGPGGETNITVSLSSGSGFGTTAGSGAGSSTGSGAGSSTGSGVGSSTGAGSSTGSGAGSSTGSGAASSTGSAEKYSNFQIISKRYRARMNF